MAAASRWRERGPGEEGRVGSEQGASVSVAGTRLAAPCGRGGGAGLGEEGCQGEPVYEGESAPSTQALGPGSGGGGRGRGRYE